LLVLKTLSIYLPIHCITNLFLTTLFFSFSVAIVGMSVALLLAVMADRIIRVSWRIKPC